MNSPDPASGENAALVPSAESSLTEVQKVIDSLQAKITDAQNVWKRKEIYIVATVGFALGVCMRFL